MKKIIFFLLLTFFHGTISHAGGGIAHMYMAEQAIAKLPSFELQALLNQHKNAYLVGSYYPDSGYVHPNQYGEDSHWQPFINTFVDYLKDTYQDPIHENPRLVAFLFGIAAHHIADIITHWTFYPYIEKHDCPGHPDQAHSMFGDTGIDLVLNVDENQWTAAPTSWWVPVKDLVAIYQRMGKPQYTAKQIIYGNSILFLAGIGERAISGPAYLYLRWQMPWTAKHYLNWPDGGMQADEQRIADYQMELWQRLTHNLKMPAEHEAINHVTHTTSPAQALAKEWISEGIVSVDTEKKEDGSVIIQTPVIHHVKAFNTKTAALLQTILNAL